MVIRISNRPALSFDLWAYSPHPEPPVLRVEAIPQARQMSSAFTFFTCLLIWKHFFLFWNCIVHPEDASFTDHRSIIFAFQICRFRSASEAIKKVPVCRSN
jgi:hypothetical protein